MNKRTSMRVSMTFAAALLGPLALPGHAQTNQGQIAGNVLDPSGAVIPNAKISAKNEATGSIYNVNSTSSGAYRFPSIDLGRYTITVNAPGFRQQVSTGVEVRVQTVTAFDVHLSTGGATETVTVDANAPTVEAESSDVGGTITDRQVVDLPLALGGVGAMRSPESFVFLIPGTAGPGTGNNANGIFISKIGGGQNFGNEVLLDGSDQTRSENGSSFDEESPSVEAISEFKVSISTPSAEFGHTSGGIENFVTKSGTNHVHGTAYGLFQNEALNANNWFKNGYQAYYNSIGDTADANRYKRALDRQFDYGINAGAPLVIPHIYNGRDRTFGFFSWEQYRRNGGGTATSSVPTVAERAGDFSALLNNGTNGQINPCDGTPILNGQIFDPATTRTVNGIRCRTAFPGNIIPASRFSKVGQNIAAFYPAPTTAALGGNYTLASSSTLFNTTYTIRVDQNVGKSDKLFASYSTRENQRDNPQNITFPGPVDPAVQTQDFLTHFSRAGWDHTFSPTVLNHLNLGYNRSNSINGSIWSQDGTNYNTQLGTPFTIGFPRVDVGGFTSLSKNQDDDNIDNGLRVNEVVSWQKGRHSLRFGVDWRYQEYSTFAHGAQNGYLSFQGGETRATQTGNFNSGTGNGFASLLLGAGDNANSTLPFHIAKWLSTYTAGFAQDDFKVNNSLVLNLGLRYSVDVPRREAHNNTSNFDPTAIDPKNGLPGALVFGTTNCQNCNTRWADTYYKDIAPRVGFAFSPVSLNNKFALRGGFATLYAPLLYNDFGNGETTGYITPTIQTGNGFDPAFALDGGVKPSIAGTNLDPGFWDNGNADAPVSFSNYIKPSYGRPAQINQWNLQIQQELAKDLIMTLGYIGSAGSHLKSGIENLNNMPRSNFSRGDALVSHDLTSNGVTAPYTAFNGQVQQALRPFPQYGFIATDCCIQNVGHSSYEALIASLERRMRQGLSLTASYTWSKSITNADSALPGTNGGVAQEQDPFNSKSQKSLSIQDIPNTFVTSFLYELPFGKGKPFLNFSNPIARSLISGFEIGGILRYQSGEPESFGGANGIPGWDNFIEFTRIQNASFASPARRGKINPFRQFVLQHTPATATAATSFVPDPNVDSEFNGLRQSISANTGAPENPAYATLQTNPAFYDQNNANNRRLRAVRTTGPTADNGGFLFGNVPRVTGEVRNYHYNNEDFSFLKKTPITEGTLLILKLEMLNAFNRHIFGTPDLQPYDGGFGVPGYTIDDPTSTGNFGRVLQLTGRIQF